MIHPQALNERTYKRRAKLGMSHGRIGKAGAKLSINVRHSIFLRDFGQVGRPLYAARCLKLGPCKVGKLKSWARRGVVDDEIHLRPIFSRLANVPGRRILPYASK